MAELRARGLGMGYGIVAALLGVPTGAALTVLAQAGQNVQDVLMRWVPLLMGLSVWFVLPVPTDPHARKRRLKHVGLSALALLVADVLVLVTFMRARGAL